MKKAILFDIDGTVLDAWDFVFGSVKNSVTVHKLLPLTDKKIKKAMGKALNEFYKTLFPGIDSIMLANTHRQFQEENFHLIKPFPKTKKTLQSLTDMGFLLAAVSNRMRDSLVKSLKLTETFHYFDVVVCADDVGNPKPHQEHLLAALGQLGVEPVNSYMVGDTESDILAGKNAAVKTVGAAYGWMGKDIVKYKPDFIIDDIDELLKILK